MTLPEITGYPDQCVAYVLFTGSKKNSDVNAAWQKRLWIIHATALSIDCGISYVTLSIRLEAMINGHMVIASKIYQFNNVSTMQ